MPSPLVVFAWMFGLWLISSGALGQEIPTGFKFERYAQLWERNPFTLANPSVQERQPSALDKLFLASWLRDSGKDVILVQNSETNEVQSVTGVPNQNNLRLIAIRPNLNPQLVDALVSNGKEQGTLKFRFDVQLFTGQPPVGAAGQGSNQVEMARGPGSTSPGSLPSSQSPGSSPNPRAAHSIYPGMTRVHHEGGSAPTPGLKQIPRKHFSRDSSATQ
jgi:hypothetical protein